MTRSSTIDYIYDFGDSWQERVKVEKALPAMPELKLLPLCTAGANATRQTIAAARRAAWTSCRQWPIRGAKNTRT